ncbi:MAG: DUF6527 family protein [Verrucomicrobiota bacterium]
MKHILYKNDDGLLLFWCPGCDEPHGCWTGTPNHLTGAKWTWNDDMERPTFSPSLLLTGYSSHGQERCCHSFVRDGQIQFLTDSSHSLAGKTVPLNPW